MHEHEHEAPSGRLGIALVITLGYMAVEIAGGLLFNSLALLADASHMLSDAMALGLSWIAVRIGRRSAGERHTFGFKRSEILAALANGLALWVIAALVMYEAVNRIYAPMTVQGAGMLAVAFAGLAVNLAIAALLFKGRKESLNIKGAFLHVVADAMGSVGAIVAALVILFTGRNWVDPFASILIGLLVLYSSWGLVKESVHILMEGVPAGIDVKQIEQAMVQQAGVCCVYDLHVWSITSGRNSISAHVVLDDSVQERDGILMNLMALLKDRFGIEHSTIQIESTHEMRSNHEELYCREGTVCESRTRDGRDCS